MSWLLGKWDADRLWKLARIGIIAALGAIAEAVGGPVGAIVRAVMGLF